MYMRDFSEPELDAINTFYTTPAGRKVIDHLPELVKERNHLAQKRLQEHVGELRQEIADAQAKAAQPTAK